MFAFFKNFLLQRSSVGNKNKKEKDREEFTKEF